MIQKVGCGGKNNFPFLTALLLCAFAVNVFA